MRKLDRKIYIKELTTDKQEYKVKGREKKHLDVLRVKSGDIIWATDGKGNDFKLRIEKNTSDYTYITIKKHERRPPYPIKINLFFGFTKRKKWEWLIEKGTELGVASFTPVITKRNEQYSKGLYKKKKQERFKKKLISAMKQSRRSYLPQINPPIKIDKLVKNKVFNNLFILSFDGKRWNDSDLKDTKIIDLLVGPEGGFTENEKRMLSEIDSKLRNFGNYTLKTETACLKAISLITYFKGDF